MSEPVEYNVNGTVKFPVTYSQLLVECERLRADVRRYQMAAEIFRTYALPPEDTSGIAAWKQALELVATTPRGDLTLTTEVSVSECQLCRETEVHLESCASCNRQFCDECGGWCHAEHDEPNGDWFCEECQARAEDGE